MGALNLLARNARGCDALVVVAPMIRADASLDRRGRSAPPLPRHVPPRPRLAPHTMALALCVPAQLSPPAEPDTKGVVQARLSLRRFPTLRMRREPVFLLILAR